MIASCNRFTIQTSRTARAFMTGLVVCAVIVLTGCATVEGIGHDIQSAGKGLERTSERVSEEMSGK